MLSKSVRSERSLRIRLRQDWNVFDAGTSGLNRRVVTVPAGEHEVERIPNPYGYAGPWLVLKGTKIGAAESYWFSWNTNKREDFQAFHVEILEEEDGKLNTYSLTNKLKLTPYTLK